MMESKIVRRHSLWTTPKQSMQEKLSTAVSQSPRLPGFF